MGNFGRIRNLSQEKIVFAITITRRER